MKNRSTKVETESICTEFAIHVYIDIDGHRKELARFRFPQIYNLSEAQATKIGRAAEIAIIDTLSGCVELKLKSRPYYKVPKAVTRYVGHVGVPSLYPGQMLFICTQVTCPENTSVIQINNKDGSLSAENVDTALQIFKWHSHRFYKSLEKLRKQIPPF